jgi:hypothetical protein
MRAILPARQGHLKSVFRTAYYLSSAAHRSGMPVDWVNFCFMNPGGWVLARALLYRARSLVVAQEAPATALRNNIGESHEEN